MKTSNYIKFPTIDIDSKNDQAFSSYLTIVEELKQKLSNRRSLVIDCYPGVRVNELIENILIPMGKIGRAHV